MRKTRETGRRARGLVALNNENFVIRVVFSNRQTFNASLKRVLAVRIRNDNGNLVRVGEFASYAKCVCAPIHGDMRRLTATFQMIFNSPPRGVELFRLLADTDCAGAFASPPMIKHARNVMNAAG